MVRQGDVTDPHPSLVTKEVSEIMADYGPASTPEDMERLAQGAEINAGAYEGGPVLAHAVAAEFRHRAADMRARAGV